MKKTFLASFLSCCLFSSAFAVSSISNVLDGDNFFYDEVQLTSGATYQSDIDADKGSANVKFEGSGSLTIGKRVSDTPGFPRVVIYGGSTLTVSQDFTGKSNKNWWAGRVKAPGKVLNIPETLIKWENESNHLLGKTKIDTSYGFGPATDTYKFSPESYVVLPISVPDNTKIWYVFHSIDPEDYANAKPVEIKENNFCIVKDHLCVIPVTEMNQIALVEESFDRCPRKEVANGVVGEIPYCVITCNEGYELDENAIACIEKDPSSQVDNSSSSTTDSNNSQETNQQTTSSENNIAGLQGDDLKKAIEEARLAAIGKKSYHSGHYTGDSLELIDTSNLSGEELKKALRRNAEINHRKSIKNKRVDNSDDVSFLKKALNDIRGTLWSWENQKSGEPEIIANSEDNTDTSQELALNDETTPNNESQSFAGHTSAPLLPSSGSSTLFIIISILGIGLMLMAFRRN